MDIRVEITIFIGVASPLLLLVRQTWNVITKRGLAVEMVLTKREESELRFGWPARVSRPIAFLFTAFYHATGLKRCNNAYESVMCADDGICDRWKKTERLAVCRARRSPSFRGRNWSPIDRRCAKLILFRVHGGRRGEETRKDFLGKLFLSACDKSAAAISKVLCVHSAE